MQKSSIPDVACNCQPTQDHQLLLNDLISCLNEIFHHPSLLLSLTVAFPSKAMNDFVFIFFKNMHRPARATTL